MLINCVKLSVGIFMKTGRLGAKGVAPRLIWQDGRPRGGAQVNLEGWAPKGWRPGDCVKVWSVW